MYVMVAIALAPLAVIADQGQSTQAPAQPASRLGSAPKVEIAQRSAGAGPVLVIETTKGTIQVETYPGEAPKTVEHVLALARRNFYNGIRVHRVEPNFVVQFGDPQAALSVSER
jgi:hypothetical protein